jgi:hypothetical protein
MLLADAVSSCRALVGDAGTGREALIRDEQLAGVDGVNKRFQVLYFPVVTPASAFQLRKNGTLLAQPADYSIDVTTGIVDMVTAPTTTGGPQGGFDVLAATYSFLWYADNEYHEFLIQSAGSLGFAPIATGTVSSRAADAVLKVPDALFDAFRKMVGHLFNKRRAIEYAYRFASSSGGQSVTVDVVTSNFKKLADELFEEAMKLRDDFYTRRGGAAAPRFGTGNYGPIPTYTPRR